MRETRTMPLAELRELAKKDAAARIKVDARWLLALVEERNRLRGTPDANLDADLESVSRGELLVAALLPFAVEYENSIHKQPIEKRRAPRNAISEYARAHAVIYGDEKQ